MKKYVTLDKQVGQTPLEVMEEWRTKAGIKKDVPLAYAGRLDPMASGKLLVLIGEECKRQTEYHGLDKEYEFSVLFGVRSDSGDVLGLVEECDASQVSEAHLRRVTQTLAGTITLPYPKFSSKTVQGKPLHTWTLEGRLHEIEIPTYSATIYKLDLVHLDTQTHDELYETVSEKIETIAPVTDTRKAIGNDFRRPKVRASWKVFYDARIAPTYTIATFRCTCSSGTYMRTLAEVIAKEINTGGLAYSIHRTKIGIYVPLFNITGFWWKRY